MTGALKLVHGDEQQLTDSAAATEFAARFIDRARYNQVQRKWFVFDKGRWAPSIRGEVETLTKELAGLYFDAASYAGKSGDGEWSRKVHRFAVRLANATGRKALLYSAQSELPVAPEDFDTKREVFNVRNLTIELARATVGAAQSAFTTRAPSPGDLVTRQADVFYDAAATCPQFDRFLCDTFNGDQEMIAYILRLFGSCLAGGNQEHAFPICWGEGANGKSTLLNLLTRLFGDYGQTLSPHALLKKRSGSATNDIADLKSVRLAVCTELPPHARVDTALVKAVSGGDNVRGRRLHENNVEFTPEAVVVAATNSKPELPAGDEAIWRRVHFIPFQRVVPESLRDSQLPQKLWAERSGILNRLLEGYADFLNHGLDAPPSVVAATASFRGELDLVSRFIAERCFESQRLNSSAADLQAAFRDWCQEMGERPLPMASFKERMEKLGHGQFRQSGGLRYRGLALRESIEDGLPDHLAEAA